MAVIVVDNHTILIRDGRSTIYIMEANKTLMGALKYANSTNEEILLDGFMIDVDQMVFEERVRMNCFYCGRYGQNWRCPPNLPLIDYRKMFSEFKRGAMVYVKVPLEQQDYDDVRKRSSNTLHLGLLQMEKYLWEHNYSTYLSFIAGACKLCKNGCGEKQCNNPYMSRSPLEAVGVNVVETARKYNFIIHFPPVKYMIRCGLLVW